MPSAEMITHTSPMDCLSRAPHWRQYRPVPSSGTGSGTRFAPLVVGLLFCKYLYWVDEACEQPAQRRERPPE